MGIFDIFGTKDQEAAAASQIAGLNKGYNEASGAINTGLDAARGSYSKALEPFTKNLEVAQKGQDVYADATGVNGQDGYTRALQSFHTAPGYQFMLDQGSENVLRRASQMGGPGQVASGGTAIDLQKLGIGQADQSWQQYLTNLLPFVGASTANASGGAGVNVAEAATEMSGAGKLADLAWQKDTGIGNANANADLAGLQASGNMLNAGMQGLKFASSFLPFV